MLLPIEVLYPVSGANLYSIRHNPDGTVFNNNTLAWEAYNSSNWAQYAIALTEQSGSFYYRAAPPTASTDVIATDCIYVRAGATPALGDIPIGSAQTSGSNIFSINGEVLPATKMGKAAGTEVTGAAISGTLTTKAMSTDLTNALTNAYVGRSIVWTSGSLTGVAAGIVSYNGTTKVIGFTAVPTAPSVGDTFVIV